MSLSEVVRGGKVVELCGYACVWYEVEDGMTLFERADCPTIYGCKVCADGVCIECYPGYRLVGGKCFLCT
jgi:hypothetical protein